MKPALLILSGLLLALSVGHAVDFDLRKPVRIGTGLLEGVPNAENEVVAFKGIPYAAPPVGDLRWREPQPAGKWDGVRKADTFGAACTQPPSPSGKQPSAMSEDCLFLNFFNHAVPSERGAFHSSDLAYWFNDVKNQGRPWTETDRQVADQVSSDWVNFVKSGIPNGETLPQWQPFAADSASTMELGATSAPRPIASQERLAFYRDLLEIQ